VTWQVPGRYVFRYFFPVPRMFSLALAAPSRQPVLMPPLELYDHQSALPIDMERLLRAAAEAMPLVMDHPGPHESVLDELDEVEVSFITDADIARAHGEFLQDPTPTDVITFQHGEILVSTETAIRQAVEHSEDPQRECALYVIHGLLHLHGHEDHVPEEAAAMRGIQERVLKDVWPVERR
jgi:probable rRNA maturation factor